MNHLLMNFLVCLNRNTLSGINNTIFLNTNHIIFTQSGCWDSYMNHTYNYSNYNIHTRTYTPTPTNAHTHTYIYIYIYIYICIYSNGFNSCVTVMRCQKILDLYYTTHTWTDVGTMDEFCTYVIYIVY